METIRWTERSMETEQRLTISNPSQLFYSMECPSSRVVGEGFRVSGVIRTVGQKSRHMIINQEWLGTAGEAFSRSFILWFPL